MAYLLCCHMGLRTLHPGEQCLNMFILSSLLNYVLSLQAAQADIEKIAGRSTSCSILNFPVQFTQQSEDGEPCIELDIDCKGVTQAGWMITPLISPVVS